MRATTKDNIEIQGYVRAKLKLVSDEATILRAVKALVHPDRQIEKELEALLKFSFRETIAEYDLADLQSNSLVMEWKTGRAVLGKPLTAFGVQWEGTVAISDIHAYFGEKNQKSVL